ncbi:MAG: M3 family oligoendopeptidase [bacterium]|nr:M3 family oligoendopeptidase [bacterium]
MTNTKTGAENVRWNLNELCRSLSDPSIEKSLKKALKDAQDFERKYKGKIKSLTPAALRKALDEKSALITPIYKIGQYASLVYSTDTANETARALSDKIDAMGSEIGNHMVFFSLELGAVSKKKMAEFTSAKILDAFHYKLQRIHDNAEHQLSEKEEQLINLKDLTGVNAFETLYTEITSKYQFEITVDGKKQTLNGSQLRALRQHKDAKVRREAMAKFYAQYEEDSHIYSNIFNAILKDYNTERQLRKYKSPISIKNKGNDLEDKAVEALHKVTRESYPLVQRYYTLKKKILKLKSLTLADIYAPMPGSDKSISWSEAKKMVLDSFKQFDDEFYGFAKRMFDEKRIDAPTSPTKRGGAFCSSSTPDVGPYVMLNYLGRSRDVSTISHEIGHAIHAYYSMKQPLWNYHAILPLCETASVFCEIVLTDYMKSKESSKKERRVMLTDQLEDLFATSHRQNMFSQFEMAAHDAIGKGYTSADVLCQMYTKELRAMFGDSVDYTDEYRWEWSTIPHIFQSPFYVYSYNFGNLLVLALYQQYLEEGASFLPKLKAVLSLGSAASPKDITAIVGADISKPAFWRKSLKYIEGLIDELETLI